MYGMEGYCLLETGGSMQENATVTITNSKVRYSGGKLIFGDNMLCSQFLRDYIHLPYLKDVQPEDITELRQIPPETMDSILRETPEHIMDIIAKVLRAFLLEVNVPLQETEDLVGKVKEKKMARLFENMDKMDIQLERRKTEEQRRKTEEERRKTEEQRRKTEEQRRKTEEERRKTEEERKRAEEAEQKLENSIQLFVESCQELGATKEILAEKFAEKFQVERNIAIQTVERYWKTI